MACSNISTARAISSIPLKIYDISLVVIIGKFDLPLPNLLVPFDYTTNGLMTTHGAYRLGPREAVNFRKPYFSTTYDQPSTLSPAAVAAWHDIGVGIDGLHRVRGQRGS